MKRLTFDETRAALPALDELRPLVDRLLGSSRPNAAHAWTGSGALETAGSRLVDPAALRAVLGEVTDAETSRMAAIYAHVTDAVEHLAAGLMTEAAEAFLGAAALEESRDQHDRAGAWADAAFRAVQDEGDPRVRSRALRRRARARRALASLAKAERDYARACQLAEVAGDVRGAAEAAIGAGNVLEDQGRWSEAETWYRRALDTLDEGEPAPERWHALLNLHVVMRTRGEIAGSLEPLRRAEAVVDALGDETAAQFLENAWGQWHMADGSFTEAEERLRAAVMAATGARARVTIRLNLAETLLAVGRSLEAAEEVRRAEEEAIRTGLKAKLPEAYRLLGRIVASEGNPDAFVLFERALEIIDTGDLPEIERARTLQAYAEAEAHAGDPETAHSLREQAEAAYRTLGIGYQRGAWADEHGSPTAAADED
jgi:tetratricopeptide (TPR) repeat protein